MGGAECFRALRTKSDVPVLIATGYASDVEVQRLTSEGASLIEKPFSAAQLVDEVARLIPAPKAACA
jgi:CheY-like chemotaxis protein